MAKGTSAVSPARLTSVTKQFTPLQYWRAISVYLSQREPTHLSPSEVEKRFFLAALKDDACMSPFSDDFLWDFVVRHSHALSTILQQRSYINVEYEKPYKHLCLFVHKLLGTK